MKPRFSSVFRYEEFRAQKFTILFVWTFGLRARARINKCSLICLSLPPTRYAWDEEGRISGNGLGTRRRDSVADSLTAEDSSRVSLDDILTDLSAKKSEEKAISAERARGGENCAVANSQVRDIQGNFPKFRAVANFCQQMDGSQGRTFGASGRGRLPARILRSGPRRRRNKVDY
eukprot:933136-Amorphochlora_amoeboformis.AAC.1